MSTRNRSKQLVNNYSNSDRNGSMEERYPIISHHVHGGRRIGFSGTPWGVPSDELSRVVSELDEVIDRRTLKDGEQIGMAYWDGERLAYEMDDGVSG